MLTIVTGFSRDSPALGLYVPYVLNINSSLFTPERLTTKVCTGVSCAHAMDVAYFGVEALQRVGRAEADFFCQVDFLCARCEYACRFLTSTGY